MVKRVHRFLAAHQRKAQIYIAPIVGIYKNTTYQCGIEESIYSVRITNMCLQCTVHVCTVKVTISNEHILF